MLLIPQPLVELSPAPASGPAGVHAADVYTIGPGVRRKRSEVVVAVDGNGVQLYDVCTLPTTSPIY